MACHFQLILYPLLNEDFLSWRSLPRAALQLTTFLRSLHFQQSALLGMSRGTTSRCTPYPFHYQGL